MFIRRGYRTELDPTPSQKRLLVRCAGAARWAYNWGLEQRQAEYAATRRALNAMDLHKMLNQRKRQEFPWLLEISKCVPQEALRDLDRAFQDFFRRLRRGQPARSPRFRSRHRGLGSFRFSMDVRIEDRAIRLPRLGRLRLKERGYLPVERGRVLSATVREDVGRWFVSVQVEEEIAVEPNVGPAVGVDLGINTLVTCSDGRSFPNPRATRRLEGRIQRLHRALTRKKRGSQNRRKAAAKLGREYRRLRNVRTDAIHKITTDLTRSKSLIVIEDLQVARMARHPTLGKWIRDASFATIRWQLEYKARWRGSQVIVASKTYPSTRRCSRCTYLGPRLPQSIRTFVCARCGTQLDRDLNAAINLLNVAASSSDTENACGEDRSPFYGTAVLVEAGIADGTGRGEGRQAAPVELGRASQIASPSSERLRLHDGEEFVTREVSRHLLRQLGGQTELGDGATHRLAQAIEVIHPGVDVALKLTPADRDLLSAS